MITSNKKKITPKGTKVPQQTKTVSVPEEAEVKEVTSLVTKQDTNDFFEAMDITSDSEVRESTPFELLMHRYSDTIANAQTLMVKKNADYSGGTKDPFANFRGSETFGVAPEIGILIRIGDKFQRILAFIANGDLAVKEEGIKDIMMDCHNYLALLDGLLIERAIKQKELSESIDELRTMKL